ncbi:MAG: ATP-binding protein [Chloroflexota bacterium]|nr:ATP-binding protein [Chloroflexota bacterium]
MATANQIMAIDRLQKWFTPNRPIDLPEYMSGRLDLIFNVKEAINTQGLHVILYGDRGTGKTSIAHVIANMIQEPDRKDGRRVILVSCDSSDTFSSMWRKVFQEIMLTQRQLGFVQQSAAAITGTMDNQVSVTTPNDVRLLIKSFPNPTVVIFDEYDRIPETSNARHLIADTIKLFSDTNVKATILLVGVATSINELIHEHQSIGRNISQILVHPMDNAELAEIIQKGYSNSGFTFEDGIDYKIAALSQGYPHYAHLLGLWAGKKAVEAKRDRVTHKDLEQAITAAIQNVAGGIREDYEIAIASSQPDNLFKDVLLACAIADKDSLGRFSIKALREPLSNILNKPNIRAVAYQGHLYKFCELNRGPVLKRTGNRRNYRWQFVNPQLIPYIKLDAIERGKFTSDSARVL